MQNIRSHDKPVSQANTVLDALSMVRGPLMCLMPVSQIFTEDSFEMPARMEVLATCCASCSWREHSNTRALQLLGRIWQ